MPSDLLIFLVVAVVIALGIGVAVRRNAQLPPPKQPEKLPPARGEGAAKGKPKPRPKVRTSEPAPASRTPARSTERRKDDRDDDEEDHDEQAPPEDDLLYADVDEVTIDTAEPHKRKPAPAGKTLRSGLEKTRGGFVAKLAALLGKKKIDAATMDQLEEVLLTADIGVKTSQKIFEAIKKELSRDKLTDPEAIWREIRARSEEILDLDVPPFDPGRARPFVVLMVGVNSVGKTTTIGKLAQKLSDEGRKVLLAAGDTFRAAATEQLEIWGVRTGCPVVRGKEGGDPSSVIFDAVKRAQAEGFDVVLADTAGRLHTKTDLMEELRKIRRVVGKAMDGAPHETLLVVDSTTGQNAISQAQMFKEAMDISGIVLTKLDGTAKGGVVLGICDELRVPVRWVGIGEKVEDLREFDPHEFVAALYDRADESKAA